MIHNDLVPILSNGQPAMRMSERVVLWLEDQLRHAPRRLRLKTVRLPETVIRGIEYEIGPIPKDHIVTIMGAEVALLEPATGPRWVCAEGNRTFYGETHPQSCRIKHLGACDWRGPFQDA